jgi:16S rRNA (cytidine1402-2'-O)-methyltransferase
MPLLVVPTPLGNLKDVTLRAIDALRDCDLVVAEDSRVARVLLSALGIRGKEIWSYHEHNAASATGGIVARAHAERVALTTDAGMPGISDPGTELIAAARAAGVAVELLPGPSALVSAAVLSGFPLRRFLFEGFVARTGPARRAQFERATTSGVTSVWFDSPKRIRATLADVESVAPDARIFLLREHTKMHEQQLLGAPRDVAAALAEPVRGEIAFVIAAQTQEPQRPEAAELDDAIDALLASGTPVSAVAKALADRGYGERRHLYARASERKRGKGAPHADS